MQTCSLAAYRCGGQIKEEDSPGQGGRTGGESAVGLGAAHIRRCLCSPLCASQPLCITPKLRAGGPFPRSGRMNPVTSHCDVVSESEATRCVLSLLERAENGISGSGTLVQPHFSITLVSRDVMSLNAEPVWVVPGLLLTERCCLSSVERMCASILAPAGCLVRSRDAAWASSSPTTVFCGCS